MSLIQLFIQPENLDIKPTFQNETSWLLAQKELQKINMYKAPREKLVCILNCCKVINNLLLNASIASNEDPPGADGLLPVLIYVTIKANPPQLHSNLLYIQWYRCQSRLLGEVAYFFTNMLSAESFISNINAISLSMEETEFEKNMEFARALLSGLSGDLCGQPDQSDQSTRNIPKAEFVKSKNQSLYHKKERDISNQSKYSETRFENEDVRDVKDKSSMAKIPSISDIENRGAAMLLKEDPAARVFQEYRYLYSQADDLTINDMEDLLNDYKKLVLKYVCLSKGLGGATPYDETAVEKKDESQELTGKAGGLISLVNEENVESKSRHDEATAPQEESKDATAS